MPELVPFHAGEQQIHQRLGVPPKVLDFLGKVIRDYMPDQHREFFQKQKILYVATRDDAGLAHASVLISESEFLSSPDPKTVCLHIPSLLEGGAVLSGLRPGQVFGILGLELHTRRRNRLNGVVLAATPEVVTVRVTQSFGNCPKYIQKRAVTVDSARQGFDRRSTKSIAQSGPLGIAQRLLVQDADTFFIASATLPAADATSPHNSNGCDLSHRGGPSGFVHVSSDGSKLRWADYSGNSMYMTLGNIVVNAQVGLLFIDYESGASVHVNGTARVLWDDTSMPGAERVIEMEVDKWIFREAGSLPIVSSPVFEWSPANPARQADLGMLGFDSAILS